MQMYHQFRINAKVTLRNKWIKLYVMKRKTYLHFGSLTSFSFIFLGNISYWFYEKRRKNAYKLFTQHAAFSRSGALR